MKKNEVIVKVLKEYERTSKIYEKFNSSHEAYAVLLEEVDELWDAVKMNHIRDEPHRTERIKEEAIQVAAMAMRLLEDVCY